MSPTSCPATAKGAPESRTDIPSKRQPPQGDLSHIRLSRALLSLTEGDLIIGLDKSAIGTLDERTTRFTMLLHLPPMPGFGVTERVKNGPALAGHGAAAVRDAIAFKITELPQHLRVSLTWDQGAEMADHARLRVETGLQVYFCDPHSPWQHGTNENTKVCCASTSPKAPTSAATAKPNSTLSPTR